MKTLINRLSALSLLLVFSIFVVSCDSDSEEIQDIPQNETIFTKLSNARSAKATPAKGDAGIVEIAASNGSFDYLVEAAVYVSENTDTDVVTLLSNSDQYTVFAPTDAAFELLLSELGLESVTDIPADYLLEVLLYHVTDGRRAANSVVPRNSNRIIETALPDYTFEVNSDANVLPNVNAYPYTGSIVIPNVSASNGIIHAIDIVMLPYLP